MYITPRVELEWLIHYKCNYRCLYCFFEGLWEEVEKRNHYQPLEKWLEAWNRILERYKYVRILITGGEPFIYPSFIELVGELSKNFSIGFDTNLSCAKEELINFVKQTVVKNISLGLSFHPSFADYNLFLEKALFLKKTGYRICVQYVSYPPQIKMMQYYRDKFEENGLYFIPLPFRGKYNGSDYPSAFTDEERMLIFNTTEHLAEEHKDKVKKQLDQINTKNKLCNAGSTYARIDNDGKVYRCGHSISDPSNVSIGSLFDENFQLLEEALPCQQNICPCEFRWLVRDSQVECKNEMSAPE